MVTAMMVGMVMMVIHCDCAACDDDDDDAGGRGGDCGGEGDGDMAMTNVIVSVS